MNDSVKNAPAEAGTTNAAANAERWRGMRGPLAAALLTIAHFAFLMAYYEPAVSTPDANGYFAQARLLANEGRTWFVPESPLQYVGIHWLKTGNGSPNAKYFSRYPPGLPVILAAPFRFFGPEASVLVNPLMASLSLLGLYFVCRLWIGDGWGLLAAVLMGLNPIANQHAMAGDAHTAAAFFLVWALVFLARWGQNHAPGWAFATGFFLGVVPTVRYPEALFGLGFGLFVLLNWRRDGKPWRSLMAGLAGTAIPVGALCIRNQLAFGAFWRTGYSLTNEQTGFGWDYFARNAIQYLQNLQSEGAGIMFGLGVVGMAALCARRDTWRRGAPLALMVVPTTLLYMSYYWAPSMRGFATMRFLLPTFFIYAIAAVWLLSMISRVWRAPGVAGGAAILFLTVCWGLPSSIGSLRALQQADAALARVAGFLKQHVPPGSILIADASLEQYLDFIGCWRLADEMALTPMPRRPAETMFLRNEDAPTPMQREKMEDRLKRYEGLRGTDLVDAFSKDIWEWAGKDRRVYWITDERSVNLFGRQLWLGEELKTVAKAQMPKVKRSDFGAGGGFGQGMRPPAGGAGGRLGDFLRDRGGPQGGVGGILGRKLETLMSGEPLILVEWTRGR